MPKRLVKQSVFLRREGKTVKPAIGRIFDFTQAELDSIKKVNPDALTTPPAALEEHAVDAKADTKADEKKVTQSKTAKTAKDEKSEEL